MEPNRTQNLMGDLCAELFRRPERLIKAHTILVAPSNRFGAHAHDDLLQIDFALGCGGHWVVDDAIVPISGPTLALFYPDEVHAYDLVAEQPKARFLSIKLQVDPAWPAIQARALGRHAAGIHQPEPLVHAWQRLVWSYADGDAAPFGRIVRLMEVIGHLTLLPIARPGSDVFLPSDSAVETAMHYIERHIDRFVPLDELAASVHLSPRQLTRRFHATCRLSPHDYANKRRLRIATDMLLVREASVTQIAESLGFSSIQSFSHWYKKRTGHAPDLLRRTTLSQ
jgi:AraC-like DNA-binding protein